ncbi:hypothetical protein RDI58_010803 [Solanum bulbocastanum]|uniref:Uncharacterized protein n=1 Tax=Solanum bulbocastanum TaxID=147425 RepID=A0AAN8TV79_SOLBU
MKLMDLVNYGISTTLMDSFI